MFLFPLLLITLTTCTKLSQDPDKVPIPLPSFIIHNANCKAACSVLFFNTTRSTYDMEYVWSFGDGDSSRLDSPQHTYRVGGKYLVQLMAKNKAGDNSEYKEVSIQSDLPLSLFSLCRVESITYIKIPLTNSQGKPWDDLPANSAFPELQWLVRDTTRIYIRGQEMSQLVDFDPKLLPFTVPREGLSGSLRQFGQLYTLIIQDADVDGPEIMGAFQFRPIDYFPKQPDNATSASAFLTQFTLKSSDGFEVLVNLKWQ